MQDSLSKFWPTTTHSSAHRIKSSISDQSKIMSAGLNSDHLEFMAFLDWSWGWEGWGRLRFKDRDSQKRGTRLAQGGTEKEGGEPMMRLLVTRLNI